MIRPPPRSTPFPYPPLSRSGVHGPPPLRPKGGAAPGADAKQTLCLRPPFHQLPEAPPPPKLPPLPELKPPPPLPPPPPPKPPPPPHPPPPPLPERPLPSRVNSSATTPAPAATIRLADRKSTRLNSSHA